MIHSHITCCEIENSIQFQFNDDMEIVLVVYSHWVLCLVAGKSRYVNNFSINFCTPAIVLRWHPLIDRHIPYICASNKWFVFYCFRRCRATWWWHHGDHAYHCIRQTCCSRAVSSRCLAQILPRLGSTMWRHSDPFQLGINCCCTSKSIKNSVN